MSGLKISPGYFDAATNDLPNLIRRAKRHLAEVEFDTLVGRGLSGALVVPHLARSMGRYWLMVRKHGESAHDSAPAVGTLGARWLFVDDFVSTGTTMREAKEAVSLITERTYAPGRREHATKYVGCYLYQAQRGFHGPEWLGPF